MTYVLLEHECDACRYISNAFSLLRLPLDKITIENLKTESVKDAIAIIICKKIDDAYHKQIVDFVKESNLSLITLGDQNKYKENTSLSVSFLKKGFSKYDLKSILSQCNNRIHGVPDFSNPKYPIFEKLVGNSEQIRKLKIMIKQIAASDSTVLILGESGTGKDVIASCIHYLSDRKEYPLVPINCGAIPSELMESELFGHEKGAFTGAMTKRTGRFEIANKGTLFLDEIGDMPLSMQVKLLRVLQERKIERVGGNVSIDTDVRLIAATNKSLEDMISVNKFREDLYYRLNVVPIDIPSLRERPEDIAPLIDYHLEKIHERLKHRVVFTEKAMKLLSSYSWPGNVRELQNFLERMVILHPDRSLDDKDLMNSCRQKKSRTIHSQLSFMESAV